MADLKSDILSERILRKLNKIYIPCDCGCSILEVVADKEDDFYYISHYGSSFYNAQDGVWTKIKSRLKFIWAGITGKEFHFYEVVLTKDEFEKLKEMVNNVQF